MKVTRKAFRNLDQIFLGSIINPPEEHDRIYQETLEAEKELKVQLERSWMKKKMSRKAS